ncbi:glutathione transferase GstA [Lysobacter fragariae]
MKLYYSPGACSLSPHIIARELGLDIQLVKVDTKTKQTESGQDFLKINPKGYVPALELDNGEVLTEGTAIVQYLADRKPEARLAAANGTFERSRLQETLGYISTELHKSYTPLFYPTTPVEVKQERKDYLRKRYDLIEQTLAEQPYLSGEQFSIADAYLFTVTSWASHVDLDMSGYKAINDFQQRVASRPAVKAALVAEGLVKAA